jgi:hypothetical protein
LREQADCFLLAGAELVHFLADYISCSELRHSILPHFLQQLPISSRADSRAQVRDGFGVL